MKEDMIYNSDKQIADRVDENTEKLFNEFSRHLADVLELDKTNNMDERVIFEGWIIQKISGLQCAVDELSKRI